MAVLAVDLPDIDAVSDRQLLERYVRDREEAAFAELVDRHTDLVRRVCRGILVDDHASDEVFQDTFLLLARKAAVIPWQQSVGSWLAAVAYRLAHKSRCVSARRRDREQSCVADEHAEICPLTDLAERELHGVLDDELKSLPRHYRAPLELCYLEGKTNRQAADELGWPAGSMARRLAKARTILQRKLIQRGFVVAGVLFLVAGLLLPLFRNQSGGEVRSMMGRFGKDQDFETALAQLAAGQRSADPDLLAVVRQAADLADRLEQHGSTAWKEYSQAMGRSAQELVQAIETGDERALKLSAAQLRNSCVQCHNAYKPSARRELLRPAVASRERERPEQAVLASQERQRLERTTAHQVAISGCDQVADPRNWIAWNGSMVSPAGFFPPPPRTCGGYNERAAAVLADV